MCIQLALCFKIIWRHVMYSICLSKCWTYIDKTKNQLYCRWWMKILCRLLGHRLNILSFRAKAVARMQLALCLICFPVSHTFQEDGTCLGWMPAYPVGRLHGELAKLATFIVNKRMPDFCPERNVPSSLMIAHYKYNLRSGPIQTIQRPQFLENVARILRACGQSSFQQTV